ncbi:MAG: glycosyltransferase [Pyrinomonadaceae bacterium]
MPIRTLYLCYFGLREPLVQTQVLPYLYQLSRGGIDVSLLTFEPNLRQTWPAQELNDWQARLKSKGIRWFMLPYHKRPSLPATLYDILNGARKTYGLVRQHGIDVLHARSHIPMVMAMLVARASGCRLIFDFRGFLANEYADAGVWTENSLPFRAVKQAERAGLRMADQVIVLTKRARDWLDQQGFAKAQKIEVVPCCVDFVRFASAARDVKTPAPARFEMVYAGSVTGLYLLEEMGRFFLELKKQRADAFFRILTMSPAQEAAAVLEGIGLHANDFWIGPVAPVEVPNYLRRAQVGISFRKPTFSQIAASPTKIPEYLSAGLLTVSNAGIGDTDDLLEREHVGLIVKSFDARSYAETATPVLALADDGEIRKRCAAVAHRHFDLVEVGGAGYLNVYRRLGERLALTTDLPKVPAQ